MGMSPDFENMAKKIKDFASTQQEADEIPNMVLQIENVCKHACKELELEFKKIKNTLI